MLEEADTNQMLRNPTTSGLAAAEAPRQRRAQLHRSKKPALNGTEVFSELYNFPSTNFAKEVNYSRIALDPTEYSLMFYLQIGMITISLLSYKLQSLREVSVYIFLLIQLFSDRIGPN
ncbi:hypothetical protein J6590_030697 [Homalodisca vitripennis]|nr:hypothetical protein J6590_030697 [Homalodisca vitripennis]